MENVLNTETADFTAAIVRKNGGVVPEYQPVVLCKGKTEGCFYGEAKYTLLEAKAELLRILDNLCDELSNLAMEIGDE